MSDDPKRLLDDLGGGDLRSLLEAGKSEAPTDNQMLLLAAKIGIAGGLGGLGAAGAGGALGGGAAGGSGAAGGGVAGAGAAGAGAVGAGAAAGGGAVGSGAAGLGVAAVKTGLALKVVGAVAVVGAVGAGTVAVSQKINEPTHVVAPSTGLVSIPSAPPSDSATRPILGARPTATAAIDPEPSASASSRAVRAPAPSSSVQEGPEVEVKLLEQAQDALRSRPAEALALCNDHARRFPRSGFVQEREVIAIEALVKTGRTAEARARADRFKKNFPGSSHTRRIDALLQ